jgi:hypothetical protein
MQTACVMKELAGTWSLRILGTLRCAVNRMSIT